MFSKQKKMLFSSQYFSKKLGSSNELPLHFGAHGLNKIILLLTKFNCSTCGYVYLYICIYLLTSVQITKNQHV